MKNKNMTKAELQRQLEELRRQFAEKETLKTKQDKDSENRFRLLFDSVFDAIIPINEQGQVVDANEAACRLLGYSKNEILALKIEDLHPPEMVDKQWTGIKRLFKNRVDYLGETLLIRKDGQVVHAEAGAVAITIDGEDYCLGSFRDITERKRAEEASWVSEEKYRTLTNNLNVGVFRNTVGPKGSFIEVNPAFIKMFGYLSREEMLSMNVSDLYDNPERRKEYNEKILKVGFVKNEENIFKRKDGTTFIGSVSAVAVKGADGKVKYYDGIVEDITERKQAENALHEAFSEIKQLKEQIEAENIYLQEEIKLEHNFDNIIGQSDALKYVLFKVEQVAPTDTSVIILGETGAGKELVARAIHNASLCKDRPLVKVNCAALPPNLIESELFGHEKGAFTSAQTKQIGRFEVANGSTIFLDEIGELPLELQTKLLRVLESGEFERLGSSRTIKVDIRIITATNRDLEKEARKGRFRQDLWYRLNVFPITVPPLRQHREDIPLLVNFIIDRLNKKLGKQIERIPKSAMKSLMDFSWPGNVRELENVIERAAINSSGPTLCLVDKLKAPQRAYSGTTQKKSLEKIEREYIVQVLEEIYWRIDGENGAAAILGLHPSTLRGRMRKLRIQRPKSRGRD